MEETQRMAQFSLDRTADAVFWVQPDGCVLYANESACRALGYSRDELFAMNVQDVDPDFGADVWPAHWQSLKQAGSLTLESRCRRKDGFIFPVEIRADYAKLDGREWGFARVHDISVRKQTEAATAEDRHLFEFLMDNVPDHIYFKDRQSRFLRISRAHAELFGLTDAVQAVGKTDFDFFGGHHAAKAFGDEMAKNIVICCDGTGNEFGESKSNVVKLYKMLVYDASQIAYYHPGVGTMGARNALTGISKWWTKVIGLAFGYGISDNIADAYQFLMRTFQPDDRLYIFGFSRGAYTARALCGMLHIIGLLREDNEGLIPYSIRMIKSKKIDFAVAADFNKTFCRECKPHFRWSVGHR